MLHPRILAVALLPVVPFVTSCRTVVAVPSPAQYITTKTPGLVWVTKTDKTVVGLGSPKLIGDTLTGFVQGSRDYVEIPLSSVQSMRAREAATGRTMLLVGAIVVAGGVGTYMAVKGLGSGANTPFTNCTNADPQLC